MQEPNDTKEGAQLPMAAEQPHMEAHPQQMSKRTQEDVGEERVTAKSKPIMNLVSLCSERNPDVLSSTASESPVKTRFESQIPLSSWTVQHFKNGETC